MRVTLRLSEGLDSEQGMLKVIDLGERPFVLGRSPDADWTVHDPSSRVSGTHFELRKSGKDILLVDLSSGGTGLNSAANRLQQGQPTRLPDDCKLVLPVGSVSVSVERDDAGARRLDAREEDDFFRIGEIKRERSGGVSAFPGVNPSELLADPVTTDTLRTRSLILEDEPLPGPAPISDASSESKLMSPGDLLGGGMPAPLAEPRPHPARSAPQLGTDTLSTTRLPEPPVKPAQTAQPVQRGTSWLDDEEEDDPFGGGSIIADEPPEVEPLRPPTTLPPVSEEPSETGTPDSFADQPTSPRSASAPKVPLAEASPDPGPELSREALDSIFTQLGIPTDLDDEARARLAEEIGATFAAMADAMRQMLATRAEVKRALGIVATEVEIGANPLKTARDRTAAIDGLVRPLSSGFLSGEAAVEDSLHSMQAHQYAMVSGIKAALQKTLDAFDPKTLEEKLTERGWSSWLPGQRKAALWDSFVGNYQMFSEQAADNFRMLIGRELDNLYQTRRDQPPGWPDDKP